MALFGLGGAVLFGSANIMLGLKGVDAVGFREKQQGFKPRTPTTGPGTGGQTRPPAQRPAPAPAPAPKRPTEAPTPKPKEKKAPTPAPKEEEKEKEKEAPTPAPKPKEKEAPTPAPKQSGEFKAKPAHKDPHHQQAPPGRQQIPNPLGYSSQGNFLGGVETHEHGTIPQPVFQTPSVPKQQLVAAATFNEFFGGDNEALIKLANASYVAEINKYNVVFG
jgi:hypothetical protein